MRLCALSWTVAFAAAVPECGDSGATCAATRAPLSRVMPLQLLQQQRRVRSTSAPLDDLPFHELQQKQQHRNSSGGNSSAVDNSSGGNSTQEQRQHRKRGKQYRNSSGGNSSAVDNNSGGNSSASSDSHVLVNSTPCEFLSDDECESRSDCKLTPPSAGCHPLIAWLHVPKCGGSFGTTLAHYANSSLPERAHIPGNINESDPEDVDSPPPLDPNEELQGGDKERQGEDNFFAYKYPVHTWFQDVFWNENRNPGNHIPIDSDAYSEWGGNFMGIFRQPEQRMVSSFNHFAAANDLFENDIRGYNRRLHGQMTSMLSADVSGDHFGKIKCEFNATLLGWFQVARQGCTAEPCTVELNASDLGKESYEPCNMSVASDVPVAVKRLRHGFRFVGLLEEFDLSVCLFHKMFGGECYGVEFTNMRANSATDEEEKLNQLSAVEENRDPADNVIYSVAEEIFWKNVISYDVKRSTCAVTCKSRPEIWEIQDSVSSDSAAMLQSLHQRHRSKARRKEFTGEDSYMEYDWPGRFHYHE